MVEKEPVAEAMVKGDQAGVTPWALARDRLANLEGNEVTHWLTTVREDGRPHVVPLGAIWFEGALYVTTGQGTQKGKNLAHNPHCVISLASPGYDIVVEGKAARLSDEATLQRVAEVYQSKGWPATVRDGAFDAPFYAPTSGPAPYDVYEITPTVAFAFGTNEETAYRSTRWRF